ncbi:hypothetical protein EJB05_23108, partial [Eragrostis curvula]
MVTFTVCRGKTELVVPARATPKETKTLSDIDDHPGHRMYIPVVEFFQPRDTINGQTSSEDPAMAIKAALGEVRVYYYPVAGRLRETTGGKLVVDCTGEGIPFAEADAAAWLDELGTPLVPPYPCVEDLLPDARDIEDVVGKPTIFLQVTRFRCGGFAIGLQFSHCIADGYGIVQFMKAIADVARGGEKAPSVTPVWGREQLMARSPPCPDYVQQKLLSLLRRDPSGTTPPASMVCRYFVFGADEVAALRRRVPEDLGASCTRFELLTAAIWRCRTAAWGGQHGTAGKRARLSFTANIRRRWEGIPPGYYGNALVYHVVDVAAGELCERPLAHAVELVREAKKDTTEEHVRSTVDFLAAMRALAADGGGGKPPLAYDEETFMVSDWTRLGEDGLDFAWAERVAGGVAKLVVPLSYYGTCRSKDGDELVVVSVLLPGQVMERFEKEMAAVWMRTN